MPAPEANVEQVYAYLLRRNADLYGMAFCLGTEDAIYLVGRVPSPAALQGAALHSYTTAFFWSALIFVAGAVTTGLVLEHGAPQALARTQEPVGHM